MSYILSGRDVLRLLADGVSVEEIECSDSLTPPKWYPLTKSWLAVDLARSASQFRHKSKTRMINGFTVPEPVREGRQRGQESYLADPTVHSWYVKDVWSGLEIDRMRLQRGLIFYDREAAIATAKAMCGINPHAKD